MEGRELYVSIIGNRDKLEILPLTELVFDKEKSTPSLPMKFQGHGPV